MTDISTIKSTLSSMKSLFKEYGISEVGLFGSYRRGESNSDSDVDILIDLKRPVKIGYIELLELESKLADELKTPVDLVVKSSLKSSFRDEILKEVLYL